MADQLTVRLPEDLNRALAVAATRLHRKRSEVVRMALYQFLKLRRQDGAAPIDRARGLIGSLESGIPDLAENHREYILEALRNGR